MITTTLQDTAVAETTTRIDQTAMVVAAVEDMEAWEVAVVGVAGNEVDEGDSDRVQGVDHMEANQAGAMAMVTIVSVIRD